MKVELFRHFSFEWKISPFYLSREGERTGSRKCSKIISLSFDTEQHRCVHCWTDHEQNKFGWNREMKKGITVGNMTQTSVEWSKDDGIGIHLSRHRHTHVRIAHKTPHKLFCNETIRYIPQTNKQQQQQKQGDTVNRKNKCC